MVSTHYWFWEGRRRLDIRQLVLPQPCRVEYRYQTAITQSSQASGKKGTWLSGTQFRQDMASTGCTGDHFTPISSPAEAE